MLVGEQLSSQMFYNTNTETILYHKDPSVITGDCGVVIHIQMKMPFIVYIHENQIHEKFYYMIPIREIVSKRKRKKNNRLSSSLLY